MSIRWPRTFRGWRRLFWLTLGLCPVHKSALRRDRTPYDDGLTAFCFDCGGIGIWPAGLRAALRLNTKPRAPAGGTTTKEGTPDGT